jgi:hypothetical protein
MQIIFTRESYVKFFYLKYLKVSLKINRISYDMIKNFIKKKSQTE